jgi:hypothetical protein
MTTVRLGMSGSIEALARAVVAADSKLEGIRAAKRAIDREEGKAHLEAIAAWKEWTEATQQRSGERREGE